MPALYQTNWAIPCQERMIFDVAASPIGSRTSGPTSESESAWMASNGKFELDTEVGHYYVTASFLDYDDNQNWYPDETFLNTHEPWVSIVANTGESKNNIFAINTPTAVSNKLYLGHVGAGDERGQNGDFPLLLGYGMKVIARIDWKSDIEMWEVRQEMVGPISLEIPLCCVAEGVDVNYPGAQGRDAYYQAELATRFINQILNFNYIEKFKDSGFSDSDILANEWWYDPKTI